MQQVSQFLRLQRWWWLNVSDLRCVWDGTLDRWRSTSSSYWVWLSSLEALDQRMTVTQSLSKQHNTSTTVITDPPNGTVLICSLVSVVCCRRLSSSVIVCNAAGGRPPQGRPPCAWAVGGRHYMAGQYSYVPLGRHLLVITTRRSRRFWIRHDTMRHLPSKPWTRRCTWTPHRQRGYLRHLDSLIWP